MMFRIILLSMVSYVLKYATGVSHHHDINLLSRITVKGELSGKAVVLMVGGLFLIWKMSEGTASQIKGDRARR